jgi:hypothetical protein
LEIPQKGRGWYNIIRCRRMPVPVFFPTVIVVLRFMGTTPIIGEIVGNRRDISEA